MSMIFDDDIIIHHIAAPGLDGDGITLPEYIALRNDIDELLGRPVIDQLTDIPDVAGTPADGDSLLWDEEADEWTMGRQESAIWVERWLDGSTVETVNASAKRLSFFRGISVQPQSGFSDRMIIETQFGGSGTSNSAAHSDHEHNIRVDHALPIPASGTLSGGTRSLVSGNISINPDLRYKLTGVLMLDLRGEGTGAGYTRPSITIHGNTAQRFGQSRTVSGVDMPYGSAHPGVIVTGVSSVAVSAALSYQSGDPVNVGAGLLVIGFETNR